MGSEVLIGGVRSAARLVSRYRKGVFWALVFSSSFWMATKISYVLEAIEYTWLRLPMFLLFISCFTWIVVPFWIATIGLVLIVLKIDPLSLERKKPLAPAAPQLAGRTAVVMPVFNEPPERVFAAMSAI